MPRSLRVHVPGGIYHVTLRGNHRQAIFNHDGERTLLNKIVARAVDKYSARVHAYCWMTNHLHLLVQVGDTPLGRFVQQIASEYARAFQRNIATTGHLFENRHFATLIDTDAYFLEALRYVHRNPVEAGMVKRVGQYPWSSHAAYVGGGEPWVTTQFALELLSPSRTRAIALYRAYVNEPPAADVAAELTSLETGAATLGKPVAAKVSTNGDSREVRWRSLDEIIRSGCANFGISTATLISASRLARHVAAREWIIRTAVRCGIAGIPELGRALARDESSVRHLLTRSETKDSSGVIPVIPL